ncbi:MAG: universal stress protein, partial [Bacteroidota bacterium]
MKKILVPTDFSNTAEHAARFAMAIAIKTNAEVVLHHAYVLPVYATDVPLVIPSDQELEKSSQEGLRALSSRLKKDFPVIKVTEMVSEGFAESTIPQAAAESGADLIVMDTRGASGIR